MPVTIKVAQHGARVWPEPKASSSRDILKTAAGKNAAEIDDIIQTSLSDATVKNTHISASNNGLVRAAYKAYTDHHHLVMRPEDIWFAILGQFSFYVNRHAEELRHAFVAHEGKKGLILKQFFPDGCIDYGSMCRNMTDLIDENIVDPQLRSWILPSFTTTTVTDEVVASVLMMGVLQKYFEYVFNPCTCGIPTVTLLGEKSDYEDVQQRIEKLTEYGKEPTRFAELLRPVLKYCVATFSCAPGEPDPVVLDFWSRIVHYNAGSGSDTLTGWISAFCFWDETGKCLAGEHYLEMMASLKEHGSLPPYSELDDVLYHEIDINEVPAGYVTVPLYLIVDSRPPIQTEILAGSVGIEATSATNGEEPAKGNNPKLSLREMLFPASLRSHLSLLGRKVLGSCQGGKEESPPVQDIRPKTPKSDNPPRLTLSFMDSDTQTKPYEAAARAVPVSVPNPVPKSGPVPATEVQQPPLLPVLDTVQPVSAWWMYKKGSGKIDMTAAEFIHKKETEEWSGSSTKVVS